MQEDREVAQKLSQICARVEKMLDTTIDGFVHHSLKKIEEAEGLGEDSLKDGEELIASMTNAADVTKEEKEKLKALVAATSHLERAVEAIKGMFPHMRTKINEEILFSDRAIGEMKYLFENTREVVKSAGDTFLTRNQFLMERVLEKGVLLNEIADSYALSHEDRLIAGVCMPKSSPLYINILECIVRVNWHTTMAIKKFFFFKETPEA
ncbi:MAG TPA: hypothetical protein ACFYD3_09105 [Candidatus Hypogeohydataceae bacterium YC41]